MASFLSASALDAASIAVQTAATLVGLRKAGVVPSRRIGVYCKPARKLEEQA